MELNSNPFLRPFFAWLCLCMFGCSHAPVFRSGEHAPEIIGDLQIKKMLKLPDNYLINHFEGGQHPVRIGSLAGASQGALFSYVDPNKSASGLVYIAWQSNGFKTLWHIKEDQPLSFKKIGERDSTALICVEKLQGSESSDFYIFNGLKFEKLETHLFGKSEFDDLDGDGFVEALVRQDASPVIFELDSDKMAVLNRKYGLGLKPIEKPEKVKGTTAVYSFQNRSWRYSAGSIEEFISRQSEIHRATVDQFSGVDPGSSRFAVAMSGCEPSNDESRASLLRAYISLVTLAAKAKKPAESRAYVERATSKLDKAISSIATGKNRGTSQIRVCLTASKAKLMATEQVLLAQRRPEKGANHEN